MKDFKKPNLNAPRFRPGSASVLKKSTYHDFCKKFPRHSGISFEKFKEIIRLFNEFVVLDAIDNREGVSLPESLGFILLGSCPSAKKRNVDIKKSIEAGFSVKYQNWHSDNRLLKIFYTNSADKYGFRNRRLWSFKAVKSFRKKASVAFKTNWPKYIEVPSMKKISDIFARKKRQDKAIRNSAIIPEGYDEFKF